MNDTEVQGMDLRVFGVTDETECLTSCLEDSECIAYVVDTCPEIDNREDSNSILYTCWYIMLITIRQTISHVLRNAVDTSAVVTVRHKSSVTGTQTVDCKCSETVGEHPARPVRLLVECCIVVSEAQLAYRNFYCSGQHLSANGKVYQLHIGK